MEVEEGGGDVWIFFLVSVHVLNDTTLGAHDEKLYQNEEELDVRKSLK